MPKRLRPKNHKNQPSQKSKKPKQSVCMLPKKRTSFPRSCKTTSSQDLSKSAPLNYNQEFGSFISSYNTSIMNSNQGKKSDRPKQETKKKIDKDDSGDELDVLFDLQEDKKNKIYEVITVMSDDETPNQISYERIYAEDPEKRVVDPSEVESVVNKVANPQIADGIFKLNDDVVVEVIKEVESLKETNEDPSKQSEANTVSVIKSNIKNTIVNLDENKNDSDDEIVCVAVLDAKTKAEMKKATVEEICLSSDSDSDVSPTVPPIRLKKHPVPNYSNWSSISVLENSASENSMGFYRYPGNKNVIYPYYKQKSKGSKKTYPNLEWESASSSNIRSSSEYSASSPDSSKILSSDESSSNESSDLEQSQRKISASSDTEKSSSSSTSSQEDKEIYWKADRQLRRKQDLMYEEFTDLGRRIHQGTAELTDSNFTFKLMSYNVLAQNLLEEHMFLYKHHDRRALGWARRWGLLFADIKDENPEILCLQEVEEAYLHSHYSKFEELGYKYVYKKRTSEFKDGVAVFYKEAVFEEEAHSRVEYYQPGVSVLDRDNVGVVVRLRLKDWPNQAIVVATTHLLYNPRRSDVRLAQIQLLLAEIDRLAYNKNTLTYFPVILTGDFNLRPNNGVYKLLTEGSLPYEGMSRRNLGPAQDANVLPKTLLPHRLGVTDKCQHVEVLDARVRGEDGTSSKVYHSEFNRDPKQECALDDRFESGTLSHGFQFQSVYPHWKSDGQKEASTHHDSWITVDYIFYSSPKLNEENSLQLVSRLRLPTQDECTRFLRHLPNFAFGSDHLPLAGKFLLRH